MIKYNSNDHNKLIDLKINQSRHKSIARNKLKNNVLRYINWNTISSSLCYRNKHDQIEFAIIESAYDILKNRITYRMLSYIYINDNWIVDQTFINHNKENILNFKANNPNNPSFLFTQHIASNTFTLINIPYTLTIRPGQEQFHTMEIANYYEQIQYAAMNEKIMIFIDSYQQILVLQATYDTDIDWQIINSLSIPNWLHQEDQIVQVQLITSNKTSEITYLLILYEHGYLASLVIDTDQSNYDTDELTFEMLFYHDEEFLELIIMTVVGMFIYFYYRYIRR